jgi:hypothetical protein
MASPPPYTFFEFHGGSLGGVSLTDVRGRRPGVTIHETTPVASDHPSSHPFKQRIAHIASAEGTVHSFELFDRHGLDLLFTDHDRIVLAT